MSALWIGFSIVRVCKSVPNGLFALRGCMSALWIGFAIVSTCLHVRTERFVFFEWLHVRTPTVCFLCVAACPHFGSVFPLYVSASPYPTVCLLCVAACPHFG